MNISNKSQFSTIFFKSKTKNNSQRNSKIHPNPKLGLLVKKTQYINGDKIPFNIIQPSSTPNKKRASRLRACVWCAGPILDPNLVAKTWRACDLFLVGIWFIQAKWWCNWINWIYFSMEESVWRFQSRFQWGFVNGFDHDTSGVDHETPWKFSHQSDLGMLLNWLILVIKELDLN